MNHLNKFYKNVTIEKTDKNILKGFDYQIKLDNKRIKTPDNNFLLFPSYDLALLTKIELQIQKDYLILSNMPMFQLSKQLLDLNMNNDLLNNSKNRILKFILNDTICGRDLKDELKIIQDESYEKILKLFIKETGIILTTQEPNNFFSSNIDDDNFNKFKNYIENMSPNILGIFDSMSSSLKSPILSYLVLNDKITIKEATYLSLLEEIYQYKLYGKLEDIHDFNEKELNIQITSCKMYYDLL